MTDPVKIIVGEGDITEVQVPEYNLIQTGGGGSGSDGATFFPEVSQEGVISWTNDGGYDNPEPVNIKGPAGNDGSDGSDGENGQNGVTFTPSVSDAGIISWTNDGDLPNPSPVNIKGSDGEDGADGVSPAVTFGEITGGHTMTVTDKTHPTGQTINIMDGDDGSAGADGTTFTPAVDASGNLSWTNDGGKQNPPTVNIKGPQGEDAPDDYILVQTTQPSSETNAIWVDPSDETEVELPTWEEFSDLKSALKSTVSLDSAPVAFSVDGSGYVRYAVGNVATSALSSHTNYIDVSYFKSLQYKRQGATISNPASGMAFYDENLEYISGDATLSSQEETGYLTELRTIKVPEDAKYARFSVYTDVSTYGNFELFGETKIANDVNCLNDAVFTDVAVDFESADVVNRIIAASTGKWASGGSSYIIPIESAKSLTVTSNSSQVSVIGILKSSNAVSNTVPDYATGCSRTTVPKGQTKTFEIPSDAKYVAIMLNAGNNIYTPESVEIRYENYVTKSELAELEEAWQGITHEKPNSIGELNVVRRCRQMTDIKWTPAFDIPRISQLDGGSGVYFEDVFKAGTEYTGIPYGQANRHAAQWGKDAVIGFKPGWEIGFDTFISAVGNPESIVAKDSVYEATTGVHRASFYAIVCTALTGYALALPEYYPTDQQGYAPGMTDLGAVSSINLEDIHLGDMLWKSTHGAIITDKLRNSDGEIIGIEISEATTIGNADWNVQGSQYGGICRRQMRSLADFAKWGSYHLYRYADVDNTPYEKSPYVDTGNEGDFTRTTNFPVLPYMGENFKYVQGYIPSTKILTPAYRANETNKLRVMKDGNPWNANGTTDYYDVSGAYVSVEFSDVGTYEAYLCKLSNGEEVNKTKACHWTVVEPSA